MTEKTEPGPLTEPNLYWCAGCMQIFMGWHRGIEEVCSHCSRSREDGNEFQKLFVGEDVRGAFAFVSQVIEQKVDAMRRNSTTSEEDMWAKGMEDALEVFEEGFAGVTDE